MWKKRTKIIGGGNRMEGKMVVTIDEQVMIERGKEVVKKTRMARQMKALTIFLWIPLFVVSAVACLVCISVEYTATHFPIFILLLVGIGIMLWCCTKGYQFWYMHHWKKQMKSFHLPLQRNVEFDETGVSVSHDKFMMKLLWENIDVVCENNEYWFIEPTGIVIDKSQLTQEQVQFISEKCQEISAKKKRL